MNPKKIDFVGLRMSQDDAQKSVQPSKTEHLPAAAVGVAKAAP